MEIIKIKIDDLKPYKNNAKLHPEWQIEQIIKSIEQFGFNDPIAIWGEDNIIVEGHGRLEAVKKLGYTEVECIRLDHLTEEERKAYTLAHNKTTMNSDFDFDLLKLELDDIKGIDMSDFGFELDLDDEEVVEDDYELEVPEEPKAKLGDIYQLGNHRLMCGDSTSVDDVEKLMSNKKINCVFTSPPYNMNNDMYENYEDNLESKEYIDFNLNVIKNIKNCLDGFVFWNISYNKNQRNEFLTIALEISKILNFKEMIIWNKKKAMPIRSNEIMTRTYEDIFLYDNIEDNDFEIINLYENKRGLLYNKKKNKIIKNYWEINVTNNTQLENHKACFPVSLPAEGIKLTTEEGQIVYDPFGGSGSTLIACEQLNRNCYMMELDPRYIDVIIDRWETFTGKKAIKIGETK
jgi:DNA modification methylase